MENFNSLQDLLIWVIYSGGAILFASWVLDKFPKFVALPPETKKLINQILSVVLALGAYAIVTYVPKEVFEMLNPWFMVAFGTIILYSGQQAVHSLTK